jgi:large subunit ribosomal protein L36
MNIFTSLRSTVWKTGALKLIQNMLPRHDAQRSYFGITKSFSLINTNSTGLKNESLPLLTPKVPILSSTCGFKVKKVLKRRCKDCYFVVRRGRMYVMCKTHPRHKQMAMKAPAEARWILTYACQSRIRPWWYCVPLSVVTYLGARISRLLVM